MFERPGRDLRPPFWVDLRPPFWVDLRPPFCPFCGRGFACISVFSGFGVLAGTRFCLLLGTVLDRVSGHLGTPLSIPPYLKSLDVYLTIRNKNPYPVLFRFCEN
jgi:hypothetical protein